MKHMISLLNALSYPRAILMSPLAGVHTIFMSAVVIFCSAVLRSESWRDWAIARIWAAPILWLHGIKTEVRGLERLQGMPAGYLVLFNHSSHMDIPILFAGLPKLVKFGAKVELFRVPVFGKAMQWVGALPIDRGNRNKVMKVYEQAEARLNAGEVFALAPEGTRQPEPKIGKFKRGPFEFAFNAKAFIVPITLAGAFEVFPKGAWGINTGRWQRHVLMEIGEPVPTAGLNQDDLEHLQNSVRERMEKDFHRLHNELYGF